MADQNEAAKPPAEKSWWEKMMGTKSDADIQADTKAREDAMKRLKGMSENMPKTERNKQIDEILNPK